MFVESLEIGQFWNFLVALFKLSNPDSLGVKNDFLRLIKLDIFLEFRSLTLTRSLRRKMRIRWFFDVSKVKESSLFKSDLTCPPPQIFDAHLLVNTNLTPSSLQFLVGFYIKIMFWGRWFYSLFERMRLKIEKKMLVHTNQPLIISFNIKNGTFCRISDQSALIRNFLRNVF